MPYTNFLLLFVFLCSLSACERGIGDTRVDTNTAMSASELPIPYLSGALNAEFLLTLERLPPTVTTIGVNSQGGQSVDGLKIAQSIKANNYDIIIDGQYGICASGCAEYVIPAAENLVFRNSPIIGYHQNPQIIYGLLEQHALSEIKYCTELITQVDETRALLREKGLNENFWQETLARLSLRKFHTLPVKNACPAGNWSFDVELWLPNSKQLRDMLALEFIGDVCADNIVACKSEIDKHWEYPTKFIIGDELYIAQSQ